MRGLSTMINTTLLIGGLTLLGLPALAQQLPSFELKGWHQRLGCLEQAVPLPPVAAPGSVPIASLLYQDEYFELGCMVSGFQGYFAPSRWDGHQLYGDCGVDVTGAPNSVLVEGANSASVELVPNGHTASSGIVVPATGYIKFDWGYIGGSTFSELTFFHISVNGQLVEAVSDVACSNTFFSGLLRAGDRIEIHAGADGIAPEVRLSAFEFISNSMGVYERTWTATGNDGRSACFLQYVSVKKPDLGTVLFPDDFDGGQQPILDYAPSLDPIWTGYPVFDLDGSGYTSDDQYSISDANGRVTLSWQDELAEEGGLCTLQRHWTVTDRCGGNVLRHIQIIKMAGHCPGPDSYSDGLYPKGGNSVLSPSAGSSKDTSSVEKGELINSVQQVTDVMAW